MGVLESFPQITPFLWFDNNAEDAVNFYLSVFKHSRRLETINNYAGYAENEETGYCRTGTGRRKLKK
jgi:predicted 3-demethylubiquinone-9 3-methyltransferase (glyoxalase superfamily)